MKRQLRVQDLMLGAFTTIDKIPALSLALAHSDAGVVALFGRYTGGKVGSWFSEGGLWEEMTILGW